MPVVRCSHLETCVYLNNKWITEVWALVLPWDYNDHSRLWVWGMTQHNSINSHRYDDLETWGWPWPQRITCWDTLFFFFFLVFPFLSQLYLRYIFKGIFCVCMCMCVGVFMLQHIYRDHRSTCGSQFSPSTTLVLGIDLKLSCLMTNTFTSSAVPLVLSCSFLRNANSLFGANQHVDCCIGLKMLTTHPQQILSKFVPGCYSVPKQWK